MAVAQPPSYDSSGQDYKAQTGGADGLTGSSELLRIGRPRVARERVRPELLGIESAVSSSSAP